MQIFFVQDKQQKGPFSVAEIISRVQMGEISGDSMGWHKGCEGWMPLRELPAMVDFFRPAEPEKQDEADQAEASPAPFAQQSSTQPTQSSTISDYGNTSTESYQQPSTLPALFMPGPLLRFMARMTDYAIYMALYGLAIFTFNIPFSLNILPSNPLLWLPFILLEAMCLKFWHVTPGKKLLGIYVYNLEVGQSLSMANTLRRSFYVFVLGMGMMIFFLPIPVALITMVISFYLLRSRGITPWDSRAKTIPLQRHKAGFFSYLLCIFLIIQSVRIFGAVVSLWAPDIVTFIEEQQEEMGEVIPEWTLDELRRLAESNKD